MQDPACVTRPPGAVQQRPLACATQLGLASLLQMNGILACFMAGLAFAHSISATERIEELQLQVRGGHWHAGNTTRARCSAHGGPQCAPLLSSSLLPCPAPQETTDLLAGNLFFLMLGITAPWRQWFTLAAWRLLLSSASVLLLKRLPIVLATYR